MARNKSAIKEHQQSLQRRTRNRHQRSALRTAVKRFRKALAEGDVETARQLLPATVSLLDRTARTRAIHPRAASRYKARLTLALNRRVAGA